MSVTATSSSGDVRTEIHTHYHFHIDGQASVPIEKLLQLVRPGPSEFLAYGVQRTFFTLIFSTRRDKEQTMADKMAAVS